LRIVCPIGLLLTLSGCARERSIAFLYYQNAPHGTFPSPSQFAYEAAGSIALEVRPAQTRYRP